MKINSSPEICFSRIDNPIEAFITPPNDPLAGILMDHLPKDCIEIRGNIGDKEFAYEYSLKGEEISMKGKFAGFDFETSGIFGSSAALSGNIGSNKLFSIVRPDTMGPLNSGMAGDVEVREKILYNMQEGNFFVSGNIGSENFEEVFGVNQENTAIIDKGTIGDYKIERSAVPVDGGYFLEGTIGGIPFKEYIIARKPE